MQQTKDVIVNERNCNTVVNVARRHAINYERGKGESKGKETNLGLFPGGSNSSSSSRNGDGSSDSQHHHHHFIASLLFQAVSEWHMHGAVRKNSSLPSKMAAGAVGCGTFGQVGRTS